MTTYLYHICRREHEGKLSEGYIGISDDPLTRIKKHLHGHGSQIVKRAAAKYDELSFSLVSEGSREEMLRLEAYFRPEKKAWNLVPGGGSPPNLSGKIWTENQKSKIPLANSGSNNAKWKGWWEIDGIKYESMTQAANSVGVSKPTVRNRCLSSEWETWNFIPSEKSKK